MTMKRKIFFPDAFIKQACLTVIIFSRAVKRTKNRTEYKSCSRQDRDIHYIPLLPSKVTQNPEFTERERVSPCQGLSIFMREFARIFLPSQARTQIWRSLTV